MFIDLSAAAEAVKSGQQPLRPALKGEQEFPKVGCGCCVRKAWSGGLASGMPGAKQSALLPVLVQAI